MDFDLYFLHINQPPPEKYLLPNFMINYRNYTVEDFATDENFRQWVLEPSLETEAFWDQWMEANPDMQNMVDLAVAFLLSVHENYDDDDLDDELIADEISRLVIAAEEKKSRSKFPIFHYASWRRRALKVAAAVTLVSGLGWYSYTHYTVKRTDVYAEVGMEMVTKTNTSAKEMTVLLSDGSVATLQKGSRLQFPKKFAADQRKVYLKGEAFFDVAKNPTKPFLVFANETVTKVLGTSFRVKAVSGENTVMVVVKTGKVSVYPEKDYENLSSKEGREISGVVLRPNQQVVFNRRENRLDKGLVENPDFLTESIANQELVFDDKPVGEVLNKLGLMYGIEIIFDKESLANCPISTIFKEENLKQRMNAICQAIGATYEVVDGQIIINSKGCVR